MKCDAPISIDDEKLLVYAMREAFYRIVVLSQTKGDVDKNITLASSLFSFTLGSEKRILKEYRLGRSLNEYRDQIPNFLYQYRLAYCEKDLIASDTVECPVESLYFSKTPYIVQEALQKVTSLASALKDDDFHESIKFQFFHTLTFLAKIKYLAYRDLNLAKDILIEVFDEPIQIKYGNFSLKTKYRVVFVNLYKLYDNDQIIINGENYTPVIDSILNSLKPVLSAKVAGNLTIMDFGPCLTLESFKARYNLKKEPQCYIDALIFGLGGTSKDQIIKNEETEEQREKKFEGSDKVISNYFENRQKDRVKLKELFDIKFGRNP